MDTSESSDALFAQHMGSPGTAQSGDCFLCDLPKVRPLSTQVGPSNRCHAEAVFHQGGVRLPRPPLRRCTVLGLNPTSWAFANGQLGPAMTHRLGQAVIWGV